MVFLPLVVADTKPRTVAGLLAVERSLHLAVAPFLLGIGGSVVAAGFVVG
ncbi:hypothetical protein [Salinigranum sp. GCM10025319]